MLLTPTSAYTLFGNLKRQPPLTTSAAAPAEPLQAKPIAIPAPEFASAPRNIDQISNKLTQVLKNGQPLLLSLDVDGTLFPYNTPYKDFNDTKINTLINLAQHLYDKNGYPSLVLCTGRAISQVSNLCKGQLKGKPIIIVGEDGGHIFDCHTGTDISLLKPTEKLHLSEFSKMFEQSETSPLIEPIGKNKFLLFLEQVSEATRKATQETLKAVYDKFSQKYPDSRLQFKDLFNIFVVAPDYFNKREGFKALEDHLKKEYACSFPKNNPPFSVHMGDGRNDNPLFEYLNDTYPDHSMSVFVGPNRNGVSAKYNMEPENFTTGNINVGKDVNLDSDEYVFRYELSRIRTKQVWRVLRKLNEHLASDAQA